MSVFRERRRRLLAGAKGKQMAVFTAPNLFYLTDFFGSGAGIVQDDRTIVVTSTLEADRARETCKEAEIIVVKKWKDVQSEIDRHLGGATTVSDRTGTGRGAKYAANPELFLDARRKKDSLERRRIASACRRTDKAFEALERALKPGRTEWELAGEVMRVALEEGMTTSNSDSSLGPIIIASGPHGAYGHSELSDRRVRAGDFVVADLFFRYEGYNSDETRTFAVGTVSPEMKKRYAAVREAQEAALDAAKVGAECGSVHDAAVRVLKSHRIDSFLNHSVGHGVGIDIHEMPGIFHGNRVRLAQGDVITDEPGVYFVGKYGIRIEDTIWMDRKPVTLTNYTKDLVTCG